MSTLLTLHPLARDFDEILDHTRGVWDELRGASLFVTGGTGFVGRWMLESFLWANDRLNLGSRITVLTRDPGRLDTSLKDRVETVVGDVRNFVLPQSCTHVVHAAAETRLDRIAEDPEANLSGTRYVLESAGDRPVLFTSSGAVYSFASNVEEDDLRDEPLNAYGAGKRQAEQACIESGAKIARCFSFIGPYLQLDRAFAASSFIREALAGGSICAQASPSYRSYMYAGDMATWLWTILVKGESGRPYNVGSTHRISTVAFAQEIADVAGVKVRLLSDKAGSPSLAAQEYVPNTDRARLELSLEENIDLREAIRRTLAANQRP